MQRPSCFNAVSALLQILMTNVTKTMCQLGMKTNCFCSVLCWCV